MNKKAWLKNAVFYEIYPTSFKDGNGDGIGDFAGIKEKLPYISAMGFNAIWLNACFESPFRDGGYDVSDYYKIDPKFGSENDFDEFVKDCKKLGIHVIMDLVIGHTSDQHPWFQKSSRAETNAFSDYYIWTDSGLKFGGGNLRTICGVAERDGGYVINYFATQPALNFGFEQVTEPWQMHYKDERLKPLRKEIVNIMRYWLSKGIDGFRCDLASSLVKNSKTGEGIDWLWRQLISEIKKEYPEAVFIAEWCNPIRSVKGAGFDVDFILHENKWYNDLFRNEKGNNLFPELERGDNYFNENGKGSILDFLRHNQEIENEINGFGYYSVPSGNHDLIRLGSNCSEEELKVVFSFLLTFKHIPFIYYGDEIGMKYLRGLKSKDGGYIRTGSRTPMRWNDQEKNKGFSTSDNTYLPINLQENLSVTAQQKDENSLLNTVKSLIAIRKSHQCLNAESVFEVISAENQGYPLVYRRKNESESIVIALNPSADFKIIEINNVEKVLFVLNTEIDEKKAVLKGCSVLIYTEIVK